MTVVPDPIEQAQALLDAATPGPWHAPFGVETEDSTFPYVAVLGPANAGMREGLVCNVQRPGRNEAIEPNAAFIAAAPSLVASLLGVIESQAADLSRLREERERWHLAQDACNANLSVIGTLEAEVRGLREERDALIHDRDEARDEADDWRQQAWMEGYPRDSGDRHPWETSDEYRDLLAAGWASPTPRLPPVAPSPDPKDGEQ